MTTKQKEAFIKKDLSHAMMESGLFINQNRDAIEVLELKTKHKDG
jgi:hypothetical protein